MFKKIVIVILNLFLILHIASGVLTKYAPSAGVYSFHEFLIACSVFVIVSFIAAFCLYYFQKEKFPQDRKIVVAGWLLFAVGIVATIPLSMNAPPPADIWLKTADQEHFRFGVLIFACLLFFAGSLLILLTLRARQPVTGTTVIITLLLTTVVCLWDNIDSYQMDSEMSLWVSNGKDINDFLAQYDFHHTLRAIGRLFLYVVTITLCLLLWKQLLLKKWIAITLCVLCTAGITFCLLFILKGFDFYFPFMVPAVALAPSYWLGVALLNRWSSGIKTEIPID